MILFLNNKIVPNSLLFMQKLFDGNMYNKEKNRMTEKKYSELFYFLNKTSKERVFITLFFLEATTWVWEAQQEPLLQL